MKIWKYTFGILILVLTTVLIAAFQLLDGNLHILACNVVGDAVLVTYRTTQILTNGGSDKSVLELFWKIHAVLG